MAIDVEKKEEIRDGKEAGSTAFMYRERGPARRLEGVKVDEVITHRMG